MMMFDNESCKTTKRVILGKLNEVRGHHDPNTAKVIAEHLLIKIVPIII